MMLTNVAIGLCTEPDGIFVSKEPMRKKRVRFRKGPDSLEVEGTPDMAVGLISQTSVRKDKVLLFDLYWRAGIQEYWLVDPRDDPVRFDILCHTAAGYVATPKQGGWIRSVVFDRSFKLSKKTDEFGNPV